MMETKITFNKGARWLNLQPPALDANGQKVDCNPENDCYLHFEPYTGFVYTTDSSPGIILATGNMGDVVSFKDQDKNTYMSRDGGVSWDEVMKGSYIPEIGDFGSIIVLGDDREKTNEIRYTLDDGDHWYTCEFADETIEITNIRVAPGWDSKKFIVHGIRNEEAVVSQLDFSNAFSLDKCTEDDLEDWSPTDEHGQCMLGQQIFIKRRKTGVECWYGEAHEQIRFYKNCSCTVEDYEWYTKYQIINQ